MGDVVSPVLFSSNDPRVRRVSPPSLFIDRVCKLLRTEQLVAGQAIMRPANFAMRVELGANGWTFRATSFTTDVRVAPPAYRNSPEAGNLLSVTLLAIHSHVSVLVLLPEDRMDCHRLAIVVHPVLLLSAAWQDSIFTVLAMAETPIFEPDPGRLDLP